MKTAWLIQQGVWNMPRESMPLAAGYLKATALSDENIKSAFNIRIFNFKGRISGKCISKTLFRESVPDILAFSVYGWNYRNYTVVIDTYKSIKPEGWVIIGGPHVSYQGERVLCQCPNIDVVVNGEGEMIFRDILRIISNDLHNRNLNEISGISFKNESGEVINTAERAEIACLDEITSPITTNTLRLKKENGQPRYDVAIIETQRGCPYECTFCYLGNSKIKKVRFFSRERLREELEIIAYNQYNNVVLCDPNFGMYDVDEEFLDDLIKINEKYGYPKYLETSWAKVKSARFIRIVEKMKKMKIGSSYTFAIQSFNKNVLRNMRRDNDNGNAVYYYIQQLKRLGVDCYSELIWGGAGESLSSFIEGYDRLSRYIPQIAIYPMLLLPNTIFSENRERYGFEVAKNDVNDFEYVISHPEMSIADNRTMHRFIFWSRLLVENRILRNVWEAINEYMDVTQSKVLLSLDTWIDKQKELAAIRFKEYRNVVVNQLDASRISGAIRYSYLERLSVEELLIRWWDEEVIPVVPSSLESFFRELLRFDLVTRPIYERPTERSVDDALRMRETDHDGELYYVRDDVIFGFNIPLIIDSLTRGEKIPVKKEVVRTRIYYKKGFSNYIDNHEMIKQYIGIVEPIRRTGTHRDSFLWSGR